MIFLSHKPNRRLGFVSIPPCACPMAGVFTSPAFNQIKLISIVYHVRFNSPNNISIGYLHFDNCPTAFQLDEQKVASNKYLCAILHEH